MNSKLIKNPRRFKEIRHEINKTSIPKSKLFLIETKTTIGIKNVVSSKKTIVKLSIPNSSLIALAVILGEETELNILTEATVERE